MFSSGMYEIYDLLDVPYLSKDSGWCVLPKHLFKEVLGNVAIEVFYLPYGIKYITNCTAMHAQHFVGSFLDYLQEV